MNSHKYQASVIYIIYLSSNNRMLKHSIVDVGMEKMVVETMI